MSLVSRKFSLKALSAWCWLGVGVVCVAGVACQKSESGKVAFESSLKRPDVLPVMLNKDLPFHYPPALYAEKVQGNVTLRLFIDADGNVVNDSTKVVESSNVMLLDSAAIKGARELHFVPAKLQGAAVPVSILFPVYFRHPEVPPPASDTILHAVPLSAPPASTPTSTPSKK